MPSHKVNVPQNPSQPSSSVRQSPSTVEASTTSPSMMARSQEAPAGGRTESRKRKRPTPKQSRFAVSGDNNYNDQSSSMRDQISYNSASRHRRPPSATPPPPPSCMFRLATRMYAERKLLVVAMIHAVTTLVIWGHFFLIKFQEQENAVPSGVNRYWAKRMVPPLEFGTMHAILFQMALIPLTMSRLSIASISTSIWTRYIPFDRMTRLHIHLGYVIAASVIVSTLVFFVFFGLLCSDGEQSFCDKFTTEMMITGYLLVLMILVVATTSYFRYHIQYEQFYGIHHLVFIMYFLAIIHTFDQAQRTDMKERSQTFRWFSVPLLYYFCDRAAMYISYRYKSTIVSSSAITSSMGGRMIVLKILRPLTFFFRPGQYCLLRIPSIDRHWWHPFSLSSSPHSDFLEFCLEVHGPASWTGQLWAMVVKKAGSSKVGAKNSSLHRNLTPNLSTSSRSIDVELKGPYGSGFGRIDEYSHALAIGGGSGIVPVLSLLKHHIYHVRELDPQAFLGDCAARNEKLRQLQYEEQSHMGTFWRRLLAKIRGGTAPRSTAGVEAVYPYLLLLNVPVFGTAVIGLTLSWNTVPIDIYLDMIVALKLMTILFQLAFFAVVFFVHEASSFLTYVDVAMIVISCFADWYWFATDRWGSFEAPDLIYSALIHGYMTLRSWHTAVRPMKRSWRHEIGAGCGFSGTFDKLSFVWITRSAPLVSKIVPDIIHIWNLLANAWGEEAANKVCNISIYITDKDQAACDALKAEIGESSLFRSGAVRFGRPDIQELIEHHTLDRINDERGVPTTTLLAFCGSPSLSSAIQQAKIKNDISAVITGNGHHQMEFVSESYGPVQQKNQQVRYYKSPTEVGKDKAVEDEESADEDCGETFVTLSELGWEDCSFSHEPSVEGGKVRFFDIFSF